MELEDLPTDWKEWVLGLTRGKKTTGDYLLEALRSSKDLRDFQTHATGVLINVKDEVDYDLNEVDNMDVLQNMCLPCLKNKKINELCVHYVKRVIGECEGLTRVAGQEPDEG